MFKRKRKSVVDVIQVATGQYQYKISVSRSGIMGSGWYFDTELEAATAGLESALKWSTDAVEIYRWGSYREYLRSVPESRW